MAIQVTQITGDTVELVFDPEADDLHVGDNLSVVEHHEDRGLIVQIIELKAIFAVSSLSSPGQRTREAPHSLLPGLTDPPSRSPRRQKPHLRARESAGLHLAIAKIRRMTDPTWRPWDGWIPARAVTVHRTDDREMLRQCMATAENPLRLGKTLAGEPFCIEAASLEAVNIIAGAKGSGTAHLAMAFIDELIDQGVPCVVFDTQGTYARFSPGRQHTSTSAEVRPARIHLVAGESLRLGVQHLAVDALVTILRQFALPKATARYFASQVTRRLLPSKPPADAAPYQSFLSIDALLHLAQDLESEGHAVVGGATLSCLETIKQTRIFATQPAEAAAFWDGCAQVQHGGALVIDLSRLPRRAHAGVVQAFVSLLTQITEREIAAEPTLVPFLFFDDARPLATRSFIADVVTPARQLGFTSFFVTTHVAAIEESLLHEADNLFLLQMASDVDVRHLAKSSVVDAETLRVIVRRLPRYHSMLIGSATGGYPIIFAVEALTEAEMPVRRPAFSRRRAGVRLDPTLPLFPDDTPALAVSPQPREQQRMTATSQPPTPTIAQVTATWDRVVKRVARRRRILETILVAARPLRMAGPKLILGFPPQHRFQQELIESEEYRSLLEDELRNTFGMNLEVATELHPA